MVIRSINPCTEEVIATFEETSDVEIRKILVDAKNAQSIWKCAASETRIKILLLLKEHILTKKQTIIDTVSLEGGFDKTELEGVFFDIVDAFDYYVAEYQKLKTKSFAIDCEVFPESACDITYNPYGVILQIGSWNYPFWQAMITIIPALLTGNVIVYKPSERATLVGTVLFEIITSCPGIPENIFNIIIGGKEIGADLVRMDFDYYVYTGNVKTGAAIHSEIGLKPSLLELSGNDAAIVCDDHEPSQTISGLVSGAFLHSGEVCDRIKRIYVLAEQKNLISSIVEEAKRISSKITPLIDQSQIDLVAGQVEKCVKAGAKILCGGKRVERQGYYYEPTVLSVPSELSHIVDEEIFGPVVFVVLSKSLEQSILFANDSPYGLGASVWTQNMSLARDCVSKLDVGMVWINDSNIPLAGGEYFQGWKQTSIPGSSTRLKKFVKSKTEIYFDSKKKRDWWFS